MSTSATGTEPDLSFPPLVGSPYEVGEVQHRQRWWFADGIWLDQGNTGAVVGFVLTHWLADRGIRLHDGAFSDRYARQLYREARAFMGEDPEVDGGARLDAGIRILQQRGLVEDCFSLPTIEAVIGALLERGPLAVGLEFRDSLRYPKLIDGWTVCRVKKGEEPMGGHAVLLNGVDVNLSLDGVTGFVRFKNSWNRDNWGDGGHALLSFDDLALMMRQTDAFLPIPAKSALKAGAHQEVAMDGVPYGPHVEHYEQAAIESDAWTRIDTIGAGAYAEAIARGSQHLDTKPPLTIGIKGAWGSGKTSLMRMIRDRLEWPLRNGSSDQLRPIHLTDETARRVAAADGIEVNHARDLSRVTNRAVLKEVGSSDLPPRQAGELNAELGAADEDQAPAVDDVRDWRPTIWFNPWMYQTGEQVWAGLAHQIIEQVTQRMSAAEREHFWLHLNRKRVDEQAVRRKIYGLVVDRLIPYAIGGLLFLIVGVILLVAGGTRWPGASLVALGPGAVIIGTIVSAVKVLGSPPTGDIASLLHRADYLAQSASSQFAGAYEQLVESPDYRSRAGALYLVHSDVSRVLELVATPDRPLVIFVDDLDRCSPGTVVQVIEAINLFVAGEYPNSVFVVAMEPEMVAAHVEAAYADLVEKLEQSSRPTDQAFDLGWRFLEKIVQLPLALPTMENRGTYFAGLFAPEPQPTYDPVQALAEDSSTTTGQPSESPPAGGEAIAGVSAPNADLARRDIRRKLTVDDRFVREAISYAEPFISTNPREIKRFANLFRFFAMIYVERQIAQLAVPSSLSELAKLAVLGIRWPGLLSALATRVDRNQTVYELLERPSGAGTADSLTGTEQPLAAALNAARLSDATVARLTSAEFTEFITSPPIVGSGIHGYL